MRVQEYITSNMQDEDSGQTLYTTCNTNIAIR